KALGVVVREAKTLVAAIYDDTGAVKGWRPLGGNIEFGERAEQTVCRELREELRADVRVIGQLGIFENVYRHHGAIGHEIVFAFHVALTKPGLAEAEAFVVEDEGVRFEAAWVPVADFHAGRETFFPQDLLPLVPIG
ncbi:MAG: NUDIX domain-containing protein, partial [Pseudomonadota bacterium]